MIINIFLGHTLSVEDKFLYPADLPRGANRRSGPPNPAEDEADDAKDNGRFNKTEAVPFLLPSAGIRSYCVPFPLSPRCNSPPRINPHPLIDR